MEESKNRPRETLRIGAQLYKTIVPQDVKGYAYLNGGLSACLRPVFIDGMLVTVVDNRPWFTDFDPALKRTLTPGFPASLSTAVAHTIN